MENKDNFSSKLGIIAATAGSAVGLGNIWAFPFKAGSNGGGSFVMIYLLCVVFIGVPVMLCEFIMGREGRGGPVGSFENIEKKRSPFVIGGYIGSLSTFLILAFYSVIAGWSIRYLSFTLIHGFSSFTSSEASGQIFGSFAVTGIVQSSISQIIFMVLTILIVTFGIHNGIERLSKILMPALLVIILIMVVYSMTLPGFGKAINFLFVPHGFPEGDPLSHVVSTALGHAFFTLSLGMGAIITYARAVDDKININTITIQVCIADTLIALLAGLATFPIIFSVTGLEPGAGAGLAFMSLPVAFSQMPGGYIIGNLFFLLLLMAALTSSISMLENTLTTVIEKIKLPRVAGAIILGIVILLVGLLCQLGSGVSFKFLNFTGTSEAAGNQDLLDQLNFLTANYMIPIGALFITVFVGWRMKPEVIKKQINNDAISSIFIPYVKFVVPIIVFFIFVASVVGLIKN